MGFKWILWGILISLLAAIGWFFSVIFSAVTVGGFRMSANIFGYIAAASLPLSVFLAIVDRKKK